MTLEVDGGTITTAIGVLSSIFAALVWVWKNGRDYVREVVASAVKATEDRINIKLNVLMMTLANAGQMDAIQRGLATFNSPFIPTVESEDLYFPYLQKLGDLYRRLGTNHTDADLYFDIHRELGVELFDKICRPHNIPPTTAIAIAAGLAKKEASK